MLYFIPFSLSGILIVQAEADVSLKWHRFSRISLVLETLNLMRHNKPQRIVALKVV